MEVFWLSTATLVSASVGYWVAVRNRLSGFTGMIVALSFCVLFGTNLCLFASDYVATSNPLFAASTAFFSIASALLLLQKAKILAYVKLLSILGPFTAASVGVPTHGFNWTLQRDPAEAIPLVAGSEPVKLKVPSTGRVGGTITGLATDLMRGVTGAAHQANKTLGKVSLDTTLWVSSNNQLVESKIVIERGTWVLTGTEVIDEQGRHWVQVTLPGEDGEFGKGRKRVGFIPLSTISSKVKAALE